MIIVCRALGSTFLALILETRKEKKITVMIPSEICYLFVNAVNQGSLYDLM